ncbi:MAG: urease accessory protein UreD [Thermoleophilaceae bacterium]|nr:urease accessory protein UreD [Thermoleophilaceae bacterium]
MICEAVVKTSLRADGTTSLDQLGSTPPLRLMPTPDGVFIVGAAAGPLNGDRIALEIDVAPGTELTIRSAAASMAWPGTTPVASQFSIRARVGAGARLHWLPEPIVPIAGSLHRVTAAIELATGGGVAWREEIMLGRHGEAPGELSSRLEITSAGRPLLRQEVVVGATAHTSPAVLAGHHATGSLTVFAPELAQLDPGLKTQSADSDGEMAVLELESGGRQIVASAAGATHLRKLINDGADSLLAALAPQPGQMPRSADVPVKS